MAEFFVEKKSTETGEHLVHAKTCASLPAEENMYYLGAYSNVQAPVNLALDRYKSVSTCQKCLPA